MTENSESTKSGAAAKMVKRRLLPRFFMLVILGIGGLYFMSFSAKPPTNLGVQEGQLAKCPDKPNCVSTQADSTEHRMAPIPYTGSPAEAIIKLKTTISASFPRANLVEESSHYLHYEFTSLIFRFVDDVEFLVDDEGKQLHFRSASRVGYSDLGANRKRMNTISEGFNK